MKYLSITSLLFAGALSFATNVEAYRPEAKHSPLKMCQDRAAQCTKLAKIKAKSCAEICQQAVDLCKDHYPFSLQVMEQLKSCGGKVEGGLKGTDLPEGQSEPN